MNSFSAIEQNSLQSLLSPLVSTSRPPLVDALVHGVHQLRQPPCRPCEDGPIQEATQTDANHRRNPPQTGIEHLLQRIAAWAAGLSLHIERLR